MIGKKPLGLMIAIGKPGPPPPKYKAGGDEPPPKAAPAPQQEPDQDDRGRSPGGISPEDVNYQAGNQCGGCAHMGQDGACVRYGFPVTEDGNCLSGYEPKHQQQMGGQEEQEQY